ncbi:MAG TPA: hypothetical protein VL098_02200 [Flavipsychrobacter sp.]|nr:hypothetical protein [Flavipsychrobacter sp.]
MSTLRNHIIMTLTGVLVKSYIQVGLVWSRLHAFRPAMKVLSQKAPYPHTAHNSAGVV